MLFASIRATSSDRVEKNNERSEYIFPTHLHFSVTISPKYRMLNKMRNSYTVRMLNKKMWAGKVITNLAALAK